APPHVDCQQITLPADFRAQRSAPRMANTNNGGPADTVPVCVWPGAILPGQQARPGVRMPPSYTPLLGQAHPTGGGRPKPELLSVSHGKITDNQGTGTINDLDPAPTLSLVNVTAGKQTGYVRRTTGIPQ